MGEHQTNVPSNSFPLSSTSAAHGYPLYVIIDKSIEQNVENYSVFFWQSMYWALFHHMTLLCMAMHTTCEPEHGQDVTADLLDYLQPQASKMHSSACNFTANAEPERQSMHQTISIYEALGESQLAPRTSRAHDTHGEHRETPANSQHHDSTATQTTLKHFVSHGGETTVPLNRDAEASGMLDVFIHLLLSICRRGTLFFLAACARPPQLILDCFNFLLAAIWFVYAQYIYVNIVGSDIAVTGLLHVTRSATHAASTCCEFIRSTASFSIYRAYSGMSLVAWSGRQCLTVLPLLSKNMVKFCFLHSTHLQVTIKWFLTPLCITVCFGMHPSVRQLLGDLLEILAFPGLVFGIAYVIASNQKPVEWRPNANTSGSAIRPKNWNQRRK